MLVTRTSMATGNTHSIELDVTQEQLDKFNRGEHVQRVFPHLKADEREFILTGTTKEEWDKMFEGIDDEDDEF